MNRRSPYRAGAPERLQDAFDFMPRSSEDIWDVWIPVDFYHPCYEQDLIQSVVYMIAPENKVLEAPAKEIPYPYETRKRTVVFGFATPQAIYKWIHGTSMPTIDNLIILAAMLDVTMDDIVVVDTIDQQCS